MEKEPRVEKLENGENEQATEDNAIIEGLKNIETELKEKLKYLLLRPSKGKYEWTDEGLEDKDRERPRGEERGEILKETRDFLIGKYPSYSQFITALTDAFQPGAEWSQLTTQLSLVNRNKPLVMQKFWSILKRLHAFGKNFQSAKEGVLVQAAAVQIFEALGYSVRTATPAEDASNELRPGSDLFIGDLSVQVKSKKANQKALIIKEKYGGIWLYLNGEMINQFTGSPNQQIIQEAAEALTGLGVFPSQGINR